MSFYVPFLLPSNVAAEKYPGQIDEASTAKALIYADSILGAASGGGELFMSYARFFSPQAPAAAPSWFAPALHAQLDVRFNQMETRFNQVDTRLNQMDTRLNTRLDHINMRFNVINARLDDIETHLDDIDTSLGGIDTRLDEIKAVAVRMAVFAAKVSNFTPVIVFYLCFHPIESQPRLGKWYSCAFRPRSFSRWQFAIGEY